MVIRITNVEFQVQDSEKLRAPKDGETPTHVVATIQTTEPKDTKAALGRNRSLILTETKPDGDKAVKVIKELSGIHVDEMPNEIPLLAYEVAKALGKTKQLEVRPSVKPHPNLSNRYVASVDIQNMAPGETSPTNGLIAHGAALRTGYKPFASGAATYSINAISPNDHANYDSAMSAAEKWCGTVKEKINRNLSMLPKDIYELAARKTGSEWVKQ